MRAPLQEQIKSQEYTTGDAHGSVRFLTEYGANPASGAASGRYQPLILPQTTAVFLGHISQVITTYCVFGADTAFIPR